MSSIVFQHLPPSSSYALAYPNPQAPSLYLQFSPEGLCITRASFFKGAYNETDLQPLILKDRNLELLSSTEAAQKVHELGKDNFIVVLKGKEAYLIPKLQGAMDTSPNSSTPSTQRKGLFPNLRNYLLSEEQQRKELVQETNPVEAEDPHPSYEEKRLEDEAYTFSYRASDLLDTADQKEQTLPQSSQQVQESLLKTPLFFSLKNKSTPLYKPRFIIHSPSSLKEYFPEIEKRIGYSFKDRELLLSAFIHRSFSNEYVGPLPKDNERLEFLGDSVLGLLIADYLYHEFPDIREGKLTMIKSHLVDENACYRYGKKLNLSSYILLGRGARASNQGKIKIIADFFEALVGALYRDGGMEVVEGFFYRHCKEEVDNQLKQGIYNAKDSRSEDNNPKGNLQIIFQEQFGKLPIYKVIRESGPDHKKMFEVAVFLEDIQLGQGTGLSKKIAEQDAAASALENLHYTSSDEG